MNLNHFHCLKINAHLVVFIILFLYFCFGCAGSLDISREVHRQMRWRRKTGDKNALSNEERKLFLKLHNDFRSKVQPTASYMRRMYYSSELERNAQWLANQCVFAHMFPPSIESGKYPQQGQNIIFEPAQNNASIAWVVTTLHNEVHNYDITQNNCKPNEICGHYTQASRHCNLDIFYILKMTRPERYEIKKTPTSGNFNSQRPYTVGPSCSKCPLMASDCKDNLCGYEKPSCDQIEKDCEVKDNDDCLCDENHKAYDAATYLPNFGGHYVSFILITAINY
ncbi:hypothetical protein HELRODRAFT_181023 [Helobdella robusta]|uniref:SCP domain-containing protein n=1 Tax=Helobdella robusta TaxID=6412 RepID=T1FGJ5_HELRO|nr:hypothetical protein HELRODRAFT_181023 [Helobdella robusta]ESN93279.1 hypothetical protein HELRODRAFT_181023 [Helobdella robusta]